MAFGQDPTLTLKSLADRARKMHVMGKATPEARKELEDKFRSSATFDVWVTISRLFQDLNDIEDNAAVEMSRIAELHHTITADRCQAGCEVDQTTSRCSTLQVALRYLESIGRDDLV